jgi:hypothetical protein
MLSSVSPLARLSRQPTIPESVISLDSPGTVPDVAACLVRIALQGQQFAAGKGHSQRNRSINRCENSNWEDHHSRGRVERHERRFQIRREYPLTNNYSTVSNHSINRLILAKHLQICMLKNSSNRSYTRKLVRMIRVSWKRTSLSCARMPSRYE